VVAVGLLSLTINAADAQTVPRLTGPAGPVASSFLRSAKIECGSDEKTKKPILCPVADTIMGAKLFHFDGAAVLFATYQGDPSGNAVGQLAVLFRDDGGGYKPVARNNNVFGEDPREATLVGDIISYTSTSMKPGDPRCCPTGRTRLSLQIQGDRLRVVNSPARRGMANEIRGY
jgi:hypothetical protein